MAEFISTLADVSMVWLVLLSFVLCLVPLAIVGGMVYGMRKLLITLPPIFRQGQEGMAKAADAAEKASEKAATPFIAASAFYSQVRGMLHSLSQIGRRET